MTRLGYVMTTGLTVMLIGGLSVLPITPRLIWNASGSTPIGLYAIERSPRLEVTDLVAVDAPEPLASFLAGRGYLPRGVPLLKRVAGLPGQRVCRAGAQVSVDGVPMGDALARDRLGRELPIWQGCRRIAAGEIFLMNWSVEDSLDGRYFGPLPTGTIIGRAMPVWTDEDGSGRFEWRAPILSPTTSRRSLSMALIGQFTRTKSGYSGHIRTLTLDAALVLLPADPSDAENAPDFRIHLGDEDGPEVGAAWKRTGEKAGDYVSLLLDDPTLARPMRANLFQSGDDISAWGLNWSRPPKRNEQD